MPVHPAWAVGALVAATVVATSLAAWAAALLRRERRERLAAQCVFDEVVEALTGGFVMWGADDRLITCNEAFRELYPLCAPVLTPGTSFEDLIRYGAEHGQYPQAVGREEDFVREIVSAHRKGGQTAERALPNGRWLMLHEARTRSGRMVSIRSDITAFKRALAEAAEAHDVVHHMAHHDALTGLPNRLLFRERLSDALRAHAAGGPGLAVLCLDLDLFKQVNDEFGHPAGDELLGTMAGRLRGVVGDADTVARLGGDEFAILLVGCDVARRANALAARLIRVAEQPFALAEGVATVGASVGFATCDGGDCDPDSLLRRADAALYAAKRCGRGTYRIDAPPTRVVVAA